MKEVRGSGLQLASFTLCIGGERKRAMMKTLEIIGEAVRSARYPFRKAEQQPKKARKHRYERRKIKEFLHSEDWLAEEMT
jgi:hypothetical protein